VAEEELIAGLDIACAPLLKLCIVESASGTTLVWTMHHLITDGWSWELLNRDFAAAYLASADSVPLLPKAPGPSLANLATRPVAAPVLQDVQALRNDLFDTVAVDLGQPVPASTPCALAKHSCWLPLPPAETVELRTRARSAGVTVSAVFLHAVGTAIRRVTGQNAVSLGLVTSGRTVPVAGVEYAVAPLARTVPLSWRFSSSSVSSCHKQIQRATALDPYDIDAVLAAARIPIGARAPLTTLVFQNYASGLAQDRASQGMGLDLERSWSRETASSDLAIVVYERSAADGPSLAVRLEYWPHAVSNERAQRLLREIHRELRRTWRVHD
jgi:nonribosomal peptide synthetase protein VioF